MCSVLVNPDTYFLVKYVVQGDQIFAETTLEQPTRFRTIGGLHDPINA